MTTKFTKGPWRSVSRNIDNKVNWASRIPFAIEYHPDYANAVAPIADVCDQPNAEANAALIASAPELYEALEQIAALYIDDRSSAMHKALCIANKALKKARGEA